MSQQRSPAHVVDLARVLHLADVAECSQHAALLALVGAQPETKGEDAIRWAASTMHGGRKEKEERGEEGGIEYRKETGESGRRESSRVQGESRR